MNLKPIVLLVGTFLLVFGEYVFLNNYSAYFYGLTPTGQAMRTLDPEYNMLYQTIQATVHRSIISFFTG